MSKIKVGVVGVGYLGQFHAEKYANMEEVELVGVVDVNSPRTEEIAQRYRTKSFSHHSKLFGKVQAVSIAVPTPLHYSITKDFFLRGVNVLLEKPISQTLEEAKELIELAESKNLIFQMGHLERFNGALLSLEGIVRSPLYVESHRLSPFPGRGIDVSVVLDLMIHDIDIILSLVKSEVREIDAVGISILTPHSDIANARIRFENGCTANLTANRVSHEKVRTTQIFQRDGTLTIDYLTQNALFSKRVGLSGKNRMDEIMIEKFPVTKVDTLEAEIHAFLHSVRKRKPALVSGRDGKRALEVALKIIQEIDRNALCVT